LPGTYRRHISVCREPGPGPFRRSSRRRRDILVGELLGRDMCAVSIGAVTDRPSLVTSSRPRLDLSPRIVTVAERIRPVVGEPRAMCGISASLRRALRRAARIDWRIGRGGGTRGPLPIWSP
jgi:hypothetical protein